MHPMRQLPIKGNLLTYPLTYSTLHPPGIAREHSTGRGLNAKNTPVWDWQNVWVDAWQWRRLHSVELRMVALILHKPNAKYRQRCPIDGESTDPATTVNDTVQRACIWNGLTVEKVSSDVAFVRIHSQLTPLRPVALILKIHNRMKWLSLFAKYGRTHWT